MMSHDRYAIYTRQSVEKLADFSSCEAQFHTCRDFVKAMNDPLLHWCGHRFDDEGQSGSTLDRPAMRKLRKVVDLGGIDRIYAVALDRVTRSMRDAIVLLDEFEKAGVDVHFVHQPELTFGAQGRFLRHVLAAFAEFERDMIATRIAESRAYLKQHGRRLAGKVPYGYDADPTTKQLTPNPTEAPRVAAIFERAARGDLPNNIAKDINDLGWPTKVYHSKRSGKTTGGGRWTARQIVDTLRNPVYLGRFADGTDTRDGCHEPIVDEATFETVQQQLDARRTTDGRFKRSRHDHLAFRQTIACPRCGRFLTTYQTTKRSVDRTAGITRFFYSCRSTAGGRPRCMGVHYPAWEFEKGVCEIFDDPATWRDLLGKDPTDETARHLTETWRIMLWTWQRDWLKNAIQRIEIDEDESTISVTFTPDATKPFLAQIQGVSEPNG
jgi:DNA invertase Pin-like site-specific DNA recombinase